MAGLVPAIPDQKGGASQVGIAGSPMMTPESAYVNCGLTIVRLWMTEEQITFWRTFYSAI